MITTGGGRLVVVVVVAAAVIFSFGELAVTVSFVENKAGIVEIIAVVSSSLVELLVVLLWCQLLARRVTPDGHHCKCSHILLDLLIHFLFFRCQ